MSLSREDEERIAEHQRRTNAEQIAKGAIENVYLSSPLTVAGSRRAVDQSADPLANAPAIEFAFSIRHASKVAEEPHSSSWLLRPYLESGGLTLLYGDYGTMKSLVVVDWSLRIAKGMPALGFSWCARRVPVLLVSAEGRSLWKRLRAWCIQNYPEVPFTEVLKDSDLHCIEHAINLSDPACARALVRRIDQLRIAPQLIVLDTMTKNSDGRVEASTADAGGYLAILDLALRSRYQCGILLTHHVGHSEKNRIRGPIILAANTDALIQLANPAGAELVANLVVERQKDSAPPPAQRLRARVIDLGVVDDDGEAITSVAIESSEPATPEGVASPRGRSQQRLLRALLALPDADRARDLDEIREVGRRDAGLHRNSARDATAVLVESAFMKKVDGGWVPAPVARSI